MNPSHGLTSDQVVELNLRYWDTGEPYLSIKHYFDVNQHQFHAAVDPMMLEQRCPRCGEQQVWRHRDDRSKEIGHCLACGHHTGRYCHCTGCDEATRQIEEQERAEAEHRIDAALASWFQGFEDSSYVAWAIGELTTAQRLFLDCAQENPSAPWPKVAEMSGVQYRWIDDCLRRLERLRLTCTIGRQVHLHPLIIAGWRILGPQPSTD